MEKSMNEDSEEKLLKALLKFNKLFSEYVKENDPDLWDRAVDFAKDFTDVNGVTLNYIDKDEE
tara:strand:- start:10149 stop:10337 length:189 start_codon:yes stop_codon:yes gene_type:complete